MAYSTGILKLTINRMPDEAGDDERPEVVRGNKLFCAVTRKLKGRLR